MSWQALLTIIGVGSVVTLIGVMVILKLTGRDEPTRLDDKCSAADDVAREPQVTQTAPIPALPPEPSISEPCAPPPADMLPSITVSAPITIKESK